jgi:Ca2+-binding RTX toxin-like protein
MRWGLVGIVVLAVGLAAPGGAAAAIVSQPLRHISYIAAPGETNDLTIRKTRAGVQVTDPGAIIVAGEGCENVSAHEALCQKRLRQQLSIRLDDMSDSAHAIGWFGVPFVDAGDGNDSVKMSRGLDFIKGGPGNDTLAAGRGPDNLMGGPGDDILDGGLGVDTADYSERASAAVVDLDGVADDGEPGEADDLQNIENVLGGNGNDVLIGNGEANDLLGLAGADRIRGGAGAEPARLASRPRGHGSPERREGQRPD